MANERMILPAKRHELLSVTVREEGKKGMGTRTVGASGCNDTVESYEAIAAFDNRQADRGYSIGLRSIGFDFVFLPFRDFVLRTSPILR